MPDLTFTEFALALAPSLGVPGKPSHELTVVAERVYDALVLAGLDIRAVVEGQPVLTQDEAALVVGAMPLQGFPVEPRPDLSRLRELAEQLRKAAEKRDDCLLDNWRDELTAALDAIEKGGA